MSSRFSPSTVTLAANSHFASITGEEGVDKTENADTVYKFDKRYEFARGFSPSSITVLENSHALYHLSDITSLSRLRSPNNVILKDVQGEKALVTLHPKRFRSDIIKIHTALGAEDEAANVVEIRLRGFIRTGVIRDIGYVSSELLNYV
jgi:hypothetical protein